MGIQSKTNKTKPATTEGQERVHKQRLHRLIKDIFSAEIDVVSDLGKIYLLFEEKIILNFYSTIENSIYLRINNYKLYDSS